MTDRPGEVLYLRDEETGEVWGPTAAPIRDAGATYTARHGQGYSRFGLAARDIELDPRHTVADLARYELLPPTRALMIEQYTRASVDVV